MKRLILYSSLIVLHASLFAQHHGTCDSALRADREVTGPIYADGNPDANLALKDSAGEYFEKPHSVAWLTFVAPEDTILTFELVPSEQGDDLDFLLFKDESGAFCKTPGSNKIRPIRSNIARCDTSVGCKTGLSLSGEHNHEPLGKHPVFSNPLKVKKGDVFYLAVDNITKVNGSFTLHLNLRWPPPPKPKPLMPENSIRLNIFIVDSLGHLLKARLKISVTLKKVIDVRNVSKYSLLLQHKQKIKLSCNAVGYLLNQSYLSLPDTGTTYNDTIHIALLGEHQSMIFRDIEFEPDRPIFTSRAQEALTSLYEFMQSNPRVHILIKGYVNDPTQIYSSRYDQKLSEERAKAVMKFLNAKGINMRRMDWKGFGSKDMLFPNPQSVEEQQANRRVEIEVK